MRRGVTAAGAGGAEVVTAGGGESRLRAAMEPLLGRALGRPVEIASLTCTPSRWATRASADVLSISCRDGTTLGVFLKHLGDEEADHPDKQCRDREVRVYEQLLAAEDRLPAVRYYGSRWNGHTGRREVFLEFVDAWNLTCHSLGLWFAAARRLASLHAHFAARPGQLAACPFLLRLDVHYFRAWAERAVAAVAGRSSAPAADLARVVERYDTVADLLARQPPTLVHNDLAAKNVLADPSAAPARICFVDWEMAGVGCGLLDLVHLKFGLGAADDRTMCEAYAAGLAGTGLLATDLRETERLFAACELHQTLYRLAHINAWGVAPAAAARWVADATRLLGRARGAGGGPT